MWVQMKFSEKPMEADTHFSKEFLAFNSLF